MEEFSCVLVPRNKFWFENNIHDIENIWKIIEHERVHGYEHRAPVKREKKENSNLNNEDNLLGNGCLFGKIQVTKVL